MSTAVAQSVRMSADEYFAAPGLSNSMMKDLEVSPLRFWWKHVRPDREIEEPTREMVIGSALHCAVLEPDRYDDRYAAELNMPEDCLVTIEDLRTWLRDRGHTPKGTVKKGIIEQVHALDKDAPILEVLQAMHAAKNEGKTILTIEEWNRVADMCQALVTEPEMVRLLESGESEVSMFAIDPETGVLLKARMDWVRAAETVDLKTFTQKRGKSIEKSIADDIFYFQYYRQAYIYTTIRSLQPDAPKKPHDFVMPFVESDEPHDVRIKALRPTTAGQPNLYWMRARTEVQSLIWLYADCMKRFGEKPWRDERSVEPLIDEDIAQLAY